MNQINMRVIKGAIGEISAAIKPIIVMGATAGAANKLAITLMGAKYPESAINTGEQKIVAAIGSAKASLINSGKYFDNHSMMRGAKSNNPAVARTDKAKPASRDCHGSPMTTAAIAKPRAGSESLGLREPLATNKTAAIAAARSTDGDGRTKAIKDAKNIAVAPSLHRRERIKNCMPHKTKAETMAKFAPLTATK